MKTTELEQTTTTWYACATGCADQALIIDETTGRNVAVAYDQKDMHLLAAAPLLFEALQLAEATIRRLKPPQPYDSTQGTRDVIRRALSEAEGK